MDPSDASTMNENRGEESLQRNRGSYPYFQGIRDSFVEQADVILVVDDCHFPAHSQLLSAHSSVFSDMFSSCTDFSGKQREIRLHDTCEHVCALLRFLYGTVSASER